MADPSLDDATLCDRLEETYTDEERISFIGALELPDQKAYEVALNRLGYDQDILGEFEATVHRLLAKGYRRHRQQTEASTQGPNAGPSLSGGQDREPTQSPTSTAARSLNGSTAGPPSNTSASKGTPNPSAQG
jgi:hypothetical protein